MGIINRGVITAEGTPADLKRSVGSDVIVVSVDAAETAKQALGRVEAIQRIDVYENEVSVSTMNGAALISDVALALSHAGVHMSSLTLRTPTLDDVFLNVTGRRPINH